MKNVTKEVKTWTYEVGKGTMLFCEIQYDRNDRIYNVYVWTPDYMTKEWLYGLPEDQPRPLDGKTHYTFTEIKRIVSREDWKQVESDYRERMESVMR